MPVWYTRKPKANLLNNTQDRRNNLKRINANLHRLPHVTVLGIPALITPHKVSRATVHLGIYCYELKGKGDALEYPMIVAEEIPDEECVGTLLTLAPMLMERVHQLMLLPGDIEESGDNFRYTPAEFERMYFER